jgi:type II secretory pathway component PulF
VLVFGTKLRQFVLVKWLLHLAPGSDVINSVTSYLFCNIYASYFDAGMPISEAFAQIEHQPNIYDVVHVKYLDEVCC